MMDVKILQKKLSGNSHTEFLRGVVDDALNQCKIPLTSNFYGLFTRYIHLFTFNVPYAFRLIYQYFWFLL
jgi:hypothetical protein